MRKILEDLVFIGVTKETCKLFGKEWTLKTLSSEEILSATASTADYDNLARINALKRATLARAIIELNGVELKDIPEKIEFLGQMQQPLIDILYGKYEELQKKQNDALKEMEVDIKN